MSRLYKTVKDYSKAVGVLPPVVLFKLDLWSETLSFSDVYKALPQSMKTRIGEERKFIKEKWKEFFQKPLFNEQPYKDFLVAMGYPLAHVSTPVSGYEGKILVLVSPYGKERVHANKVYLTIQEIEVWYRPADLYSGEEDKYINHVLSFYKGLSRPWREGEPGTLNRYILATEENIESIGGLADSIDMFGRNYVSDNFVRYMIRATEGIKEELEKVKLSWSKKQLARSTNEQI
nr:MAG TPA: hypothetical protein [Caudoviricetes sp.]